MKNKKKKILTMVVVCSLLGTLGGCRFKRNVDISIPTEPEKTQSEMNQNDEDMSQVQNESAQTSAETLSVVYKNIDLNLFAQVFMETSTIEEAEKYKPKHYVSAYIITYSSMNYKSVFQKRCAAILWQIHADRRRDIWFVGDADRSRFPKHTQEIRLSSRLSSPAGSYRGSG